MGTEKLAKLLLLLLVVGWVPGDICWLALKEVWHENFVLAIGLAVVESGKNIGALKCLRKESKNVVNDKNARFGVRSGDIGLQTSNSTEFAFLFLLQG